MNIKNIKINSSVLNAKWPFVSLFPTINKRISFTKNKENKKTNEFNYEDELKDMTTEEIKYFLEEGKDFWKQIRINEKINEISEIKEVQYQKKIV